MEDKRLAFEATIPVVDRCSYRDCCLPWEQNGSQYCVGEEPLGEFVADAVPSAWSGWSQLPALDAARVVADSRTAEFDFDCIRRAASSHVPVLEEASVHWGALNNCDSLSRK